jgi:hypothetical protein
MVWPARPNQPLILTSLLLAAFAINVDTTIVNVALRTLVLELGAADNQWSGSSMPTTRRSPPSSSPSALISRHRLFPEPHGFERSAASG